MDVRKLRGAVLRFHYSVLRLIGAIEDVLETYQEVGHLIERLTAAGNSWRNRPIEGRGSLRIGRRSANVLRRRDHPYEIVCNLLHQKGNSLPMLLNTSSLLRNGNNRQELGRTRLLGSSFVAIRV